MAKAASAGQMSGLKRFCEKVTAAKTKRFFTHCRGRSEATAARSCLNQSPTAATAWRTARTTVSIS